MNDNGEIPPPRPLIRSVAAPDSDDESVFDPVPLDLNYVWSSDSDTSDEEEIIIEYPNDVGVFLINASEMLFVLFVLFVSG